MHCLGDSKKLDPDCVSIAKRDAVRLSEGKPFGKALGNLTSAVHRWSHKQAKKLDSMAILTLPAQICYTHTRPILTTRHSPNIWRAQPAPFAPKTPMRLWISTATVVFSNSGARSGYAKLMESFATESRVTCVGEYARANRAKVLHTSTCRHVSKHTNGTTWTMSCLYCERVPTLFMR